MVQVAVLVQQLAALETWRACVLPRLLRTRAPRSSFPAYSVLFHEACCLR